MFGKDAKEKMPESTHSPGEKGGKSNRVESFLGPGTKYTGKLEAQGSVQIDGTFEGEINLKGTLLVGREGTVKAKTVAQSVIVHGRLEGDVRASVRVELTAGSTFSGDVTSPSFVIQEKAQFEGNCRMPGQGAAPGNPVK